MASNLTHRYTTDPPRPPGGPVPFRRAASAYAAPPVSDPLETLSADVTARHDITSNGKPKGATIGRETGRARNPARRASFRTPPR